MKKVSAIFMEDAKDEVLRQLKELGIIEFSDIYTLGDLDPGAPGEVRAKATELLNKVESIIEVLEERVEPRSLENISRLPVVEGDPRELFREVEEKIFVVGEKVMDKSSRLEKIAGERDELLELKEKLAVLAKLNISPKEIAGLRDLRVIVGIVSVKEVKELEAGLKGISHELIFHSTPLDKKLAAIVTLFFKEREVDVSRVLRLHRIEEIHIPLRFQMTLEEAKEKIDRELESLDGEDEEINNELAEIGSKELPDFLRLRELLDIEKFVDESNRFLGRTKRTYVFTGWSPADRVKEVKEIVEKASSGVCSVSIEDPRKDEKPPTLLLNPPQAKPLELLTDTYGAPSYGEIDPTLFLAFTFPIIFGLMFGDIGQGAMILLTGYLLGFRVDLGESARKLGRILILCGITAVFFGFMYGSIFGLEGEHMKHYLGFELHPLWLNPMESTMSLIVFALTLGVFLLISGCVLNIINDISNKHYKEILVSPFGIHGIWLLTAGYIIVSRHGVDVSAIIHDIMIVPGVLLPFITLGLGEHYVSKLSLPMAFFEAFDNISRFLVNSISYIRVMALAVVHGALNMIMVTIMDMMPASGLGAAAKILIFAAGNIGIFVLEMFVSFIQTLRLHYYEWFSKFYSGDGRRFIPFQVVRKYTSLGGE
jgi:V/A-type H+-transporting ATPase subunit I